MNAARRFTVLTTGEVEPGFDETQVALDFVDLINTTPERAVAFIHTEQQLVAEIDEERALAYQKKLTDIGMRIRVVDSEELAAANDMEAQRQALERGTLSLQPESNPVDDEDTEANEGTVGEINLVESQIGRSTKASELASSDAEIDSLSNESSLADTDLNLPADAPDSEAASKPDQDHTELKSQDAEVSPLDAELASQIDELAQLKSDLGSPSDEPAQDYSDLSSPSDELAQDFSKSSSPVGETPQGFTDLNSHSAVNNNVAQTQANQAQSTTLDTKNDEDDIINSIRLAGSELESTEAEEPVFTLRNRSVRLLILALIAAGGALFLKTYTDYNISEFTQSTSKYSHTSSVSEDMNKLMDVSGMQGDINLFTTYVPERFDRYLEENKDESALPESRFGNVIDLIPRAYNKEALHSTVASWLEKNTFEDDIPLLIEAFDTPNIQAFMELKLTKNRFTDRQGFLEFKEHQINNPQEGSRVRALTRLLDALILDKVDYEIDGDLLRAFITTRGAVRPDKDSTASKELVRNEIKAMRDSLVYSRPDIRSDALLELSWQLEEFSINDIHDIRGALDHFSVRELNNQMVKGYEEYLKQSTLWLQRKL